MAESKVTPEALNETLRGLSSGDLAAFRVKVDPLLFDELYRVGLDPHGQALFLSEPQWGLLLAGMTKLVVLAFIIERSLAFVFDHHWFMALEEDLGLRPCAVTAARNAGAAQPVDSEGSTGQTKFRRGYKATVSFLVAWGLAHAFNVNILAALFPNDPALGYGGVVLSALIVAGGSQGALALMQSVLGVRGSIIKARQEAAVALAKGKAAAAPVSTPATIDKGKIMAEVDRDTIRALLTKTGKKEKDLATAIGLTETDVLQILAGTRGITGIEKTRIAQFFGKDPKRLFGV